MYKRFGSVTNIGREKYRNKRAPFLALAREKNKTETIDAAVRFKGTLFRLIVRGPLITKVLTPKTKELFTVQQKNIAPHTHTHTVTRAIDSNLLHARRNTNGT